MKYAVIIPAKNESTTIAQTIDSIATQTIPPIAILVMNDGSTDDTESIVHGRQAKYQFLQCCPIEQGGEYSLGGHVVSLFNRGRRVLADQGIACDWIVKLDADLGFEANFMEQIAGRIEGLDIGIVSGTPYYLEGGKRVFEYSPTWHTHGQFKIYSRRCYESMGGVPESLGWDTADNIIAMSNGWETVAYTDINYLMHRKVGGKSSLKRGRVNHGIGCYVLGYSFSYLLLKICHDLFKPPYLLGALYFIKGYLKATIDRPARILTAPQQHELRSLLWSSFARRFKGMDFVVLQKIRGKA